MKNNITINGITYEVSYLDIYYDDEISEDSPGFILYEIVGNDGTHIKSWLCVDDVDPDETEDVIKFLTSRFESSPQELINKPNAYSDSVSPIIRNMYFQWCNSDNYCCDAEWYEDEIVAMIGSELGGDTFEDKMDDFMDRLYEIACDNDISDCIEFDDIERYVDEEMFGVTVFPGLTEMFNWFNENPVNN